MNETPAKYPLKLWLAATCAWLGSLQFGFHLVRDGLAKDAYQHLNAKSPKSRSSTHAQGVLNTCLTYTSKDLGITEAKGGAFITSVLLVGAATGGFLAGQVADAIGPCRALLYNNVPLLVGSLLSATAPHSATGFWAMLLGMFVSVSDCCAHHPMQCMGGLDRRPSMHNHYCTTPCPCPVISPAACFCCECTADILLHNASDTTAAKGPVV